jgi:RHS repeat-associated protein
MTKDNNKDISSIQYNHLNLPTQVLFDHGGSILYTYDATGVKLKKEIFLNAPNFNNPVADFTTYYAGNYIYEKESTTESLQFFSHPEGYVEKNGSNFEYVYQYKDHLGNIRLSYADTDNNGIIDANSEIISEKNYYPFGLEHKGYNNVVQNSNSAASKFKYNGKELNDELNLDWYDYGARNYDASLGRWMNVDKKSDAAGQIHSTNFGYALNNPISLTDPDGNCPPGVDCENVLVNMERIRVNRASNLGAGKTRNNGTKFHAGHDLYAATGSSVRSSMAGTVLKSGYSSSYGNYVNVKTEVMEQVPTGEFTMRDGVIFPVTKEQVKETYYTFYAHLEESTVDTGDTVTAGQEIGTVGTSGNASNLTGDNVHLHFEIGTELRSSNSSFLKKSSLLDANTGYKNVTFTRQNPTAQNESNKGVIKTNTDSNGNQTQVFQNFSSTTSNGTDQEWQIPMSYPPANN